MIKFSRGRLVKKETQAQSEQSMVPARYSPIKWNDEYYSAMGGGYSVCYLMGSGLQATELVLARNPRQREWSVMQIYVLSKDSGLFVPVQMYNGLQTNTFLSTRFNQALDKTLPSSDFLYANRDGCCCHWTPSNSSDDLGKLKSAIPDIEKCNVPEHYLYCGPDFVGHKIPERRKAPRTGKDKNRFHL